MPAEMPAEMPAAMPRDKYLKSVFEQFAYLAVGKICLEYVGSALDTDDDECMVMLHEVFKEHWELTQQIYPGRIPDDYPTDNIDPDQYLDYFEVVKEIEGSIKEYFEKLQSLADKRGVMQFTLNVVAKVCFRTPALHHHKEARVNLFEVTWDSRTGSTDCYSEILEAFEKMLERFMEAECSPENSENFICADRSLLRECNRRAALHQIAAE